MDEKVVVEIIGKDSGAAKVLSSVGSKLTSFAKTAGIAIAAGIGLGTVAMGKFSSDLTMMGADAGETLNLIQQTFGNAANSYVANISQIAGATERSRYQLLEGTAAIGAMSKSLGMGESAAATYSAQWAQISADMSSFFNVPIEGALADIQSAMAGSSEPMLKYGIDTRQTALEQIALREGLMQVGEEMTNTVRAQALQIAVMEQAADAMGDAERTADSLSNSIKGIQASSVDASTDLGMLLIPTAERLVNAFKAALPGLQNVVAGIVLTFRNLVEIGIEFVKVLGEAMGINFDQLAENSGAWGANISIQLARGISAATVYVVQALSQLAQVITSLLQPHSPPKILPNLDDWGAGAANVWLQGWTEGDYGVFDTIAKTVKGALDNIGKLTPEFEILSRDAIQETIAEVKELGLNGSQAVASLQAKIGTLPAAMTDYITTVFNAEAATNAVARAQEELNSVTESFVNKLSPLNKELQAIRDQRQANKEQQELANLQDVISNNFVSNADKEEAALRIKEIRLQQQIRAVEDERDTAVDAAKKKLDAAKKEETRIKDMLKLQEMSIKLREQDNTLMTSQIGVIEQLSGGIKGISEGIGSIGGALESIGSLPPLDLGLTGGAIEPIDFENMFSGLSEQIDAEFQPARQAIEDFSTSFTDLKTTLEGLSLETAIETITTKFSDFIDENRDTVSVIAGIGAAFATWLIIGKIIALGSILASGWGLVTAAITTFGAGVGATGTILGGIVAVLGGPVTAAILAISALVGLATAAWIGDWGGFRTKILGFIDEIKEGMEAWKGNFENLAIIFETTIENLKTIWESLRLKWDAVELAFKLSIDAMKTKWDEFKARIDTVVGNIKSIMDGFKSKFDEVSAGIRGALQPIVDLINNVKDALSQLELPEFMQRHSPSPWEQTLAGVSKGMRQLNLHDIPQMARGMATMERAGGSSMMNSNNTNTTNIYNLTVDRNGGEVRTENFSVALVLAGGT